ncbi:hypothetical protein L1049_015353 [Liquidambar formosana]|uniref:DUF7036 domain-containing protein n=1 Tax=Liquidambar formosana TaxID=63359 RepID=A0AAP0X6H1_LIQFO
MGKIVQQRHLQQQQIHNSRTGSTSTLFCQRCSMGLARIAKEFNFKCVVILILSVSVFLSAIFWILPRPAIKSGFDAKDAIKLGAKVHVYFRLQKPVSLLVPHIGRLEYDIYGEIGVPDTKVAILSLHQYGASNWTDVVFGVLSDPMNVPINPVSLSVLKSSLIELFLQQSNLTLTTSIFGQPSFFEILKFPGGITVIPVQLASIWQIPQVLFNFTLYNSISEIQDKFVDFKEQLKIGLRLRSYENVYVQITNKDGSTIDSPVTVQASVMSDLGSLLPQRLKQLAQIITGSPAAKNLGLDNSVFGKVKGVSLSSFLNGTLDTMPPTPSPAPSPELNEYAEPSTSPYPAPPSFSPTPSPSPEFHPLPPCFNCDASSPSANNYPHVPSPKSGLHHSVPPISNSPAPSMVTADPPHPCPYQGSITPPSSSPMPHVDPTVPSASSPHAATPFSPPMGPTSHLSPDRSPLPAVSYGSSPGQDKGSGKGLVSPSLAPSPLALSLSSFAVGRSYEVMWILGFSGLLIFPLFCWLH